MEKGLLIIAAIAAMIGLVYALDWLVRMVKQEGARHLVFVIALTVGLYALFYWFTRGFGWSFMLSASIFVAGITAIVSLVLGIVWIYEHW